MVSRERNWRARQRSWVSNRNLKYGLLSRHQVGSRGIAIPPETFVVQYQTWLCQNPSITWVSIHIYALYPSCPTHPIASPNSPPNHLCYAQNLVTLQTPIPLLPTTLCTVSTTPSSPKSMSSKFKCLLYLHTSWNLNSFLSLFATYASKNLADSGAIKYVPSFSSK